MSLRNILQKVATKIGADLTNQEQLDYLISEINTVAEDEYRAKDFPNSLIQQRFWMTNADDLVRIVLPADTGKLRAVRYSDLIAGKVTLVDMRPRYAAQSFWAETTNLLKFEIQTDNAPCKLEIENASRILVKLKKVETQDVIVTLSGRTDFAQSYSEDVTIPAGQLQKWSVKNYEEFDKITKNVVTECDVTLEDIDGREIAEIMNYASESRYVLVQVSTKLATQLLLQPGYTRTIEVLYKRRYRPMIKLTDEFMCPDCDDIIAWKFLADYASHREGQEERALIANARADQMAGALAMDDESGKLMKVEQIKGGGLRGFTRIRNSRPGYGYGFGRRVM